MIVARGLPSVMDCALTDHSPRLRIANGLTPERLRRQLDVIDELREKVSSMRILSGVEGGIIDDGPFDQEPEFAGFSRTARDAKACSHR